MAVKAPKISISLYLPSLKAWEDIGGLYTVCSMKLRILQKGIKHYIIYYIR